MNAILDVFDAHLARDPTKSALEVGGGLGRYLAYVGRSSGYRCAVLDFSPEGCELARRNFEHLGMPLEVHQRDLFDPADDLERFDLVYSLGLIEHFTDLTGVVAAHARLVRPGGTLILGAPNVVGVNRWFMERLAPERMAVHNADCLRIERWDEFEQRARARAAVPGLRRRVRATCVRGARAEDGGHPAALGHHAAARRDGRPEAAAAATVQPPAAERLPHRRVARARLPASPRDAAER